MKPASSRDVYGDGKSTNKLNGFTRLLASSYRRQLTRWANFLYHMSRAVQRASSEHIEHKHRRYTLAVSRDGHISLESPRWFEVLVRRRSSNRSGPPLGSNAPIAHNKTPLSGGQKVSCRPSRPTLRRCQCARLIVNNRRSFVIRQINFKSVDLAV